MKDSRYYVLKLLASTIVASIYYVFLISYGRKFDIAELLTNILLLYVGTVAVNSLSKKLNKKREEA